MSENKIIFIFFFALLHCNRSSRKQKIHFNSRHHKFEFVSVSFLYFRFDAQFNCKQSTDKNTRTLSAVWFQLAQIKKNFMKTFSFSCVDRRLKFNVHASFVVASQSFVLFFSLLFANMIFALCVLALVHNKL